MRLSRLLLALTLVFIALLASGATFGAFRGVEGAAALFRSGPLVAFWILFAALLLFGAFYFKQLRRSPASLALHLGTLLILMGAMWGSADGHRLAEQYAGINKVPRGQMKLFQGETTNLVTPNVLSGAAAVAVKLPFSLHLNHFVVEYYDPWQLVAMAPPVTGPMSEATMRRETIPWHVGDQVSIPFTDARLEVVKYLEHAEPTYAEGDIPRLSLTTSEGQPATIVRAEVDQTVQLPQVAVRIVKVFGNMKVVPKKDKFETVDIPGAAENPALQVELKWPDGRTELRYVMAHFPMHGNNPNALVLHYLYPMPSGARPAGKGNPPAMEVVLRYKDQEQRQWLMPGPLDSSAWISLGQVLGLEGGGVPKNPMATPPPRLFMIQPTGSPVKHYISDISVMDAGKEAVRQVVEVNAPLHYGGYHFYQQSYDVHKKLFTILGVVSDTGLNLVYAGFILVVLGAFWRCWISPALGYLRQRGEHGD